MKQEYLGSFSHFLLQENNATEFLNEIVSG